MFRFEYPSFLYLLLLLPLLWGLCFGMHRRRKHRLRLLGDPTLLQHLMQGVSPWRTWAKLALMSLALAMLIVMQARPQMGVNTGVEQKQGVEIMIALDISNSMLAQDVAPSRLARAKMLLSNLISKMKNDKVGLVVFAGDAFIQLPMTNDYASAKLFLENASPELMSGQGTNIAAALKLAAASFSNKKDIGKALILITDGENHEAGAQEIAATLPQQGISLYVLGMGGNVGAPIPLQGGYLKDATGQTVLTTHNATMCQELAQSAQGLYLPVDNSTHAQDAVRKALETLQQGKLEGIRYNHYDEQFQAFALLALLLLGIDTVLLDRSNPRFQHFSLFKR